MADLRAKPTRWEIHVNDGIAGVEAIDEGAGPYLVVEVADAIGFESADEIQQFASALQACLAQAQEGDQ